MCLILLFQEKKKLLNNAPLFPDPVGVNGAHRAFKADFTNRHTLLREDKRFFLFMCVPIGKGRVGGETLVRVHSVQQNTYFSPSEHAAKEQWIRRGEKSIKGGRYFAHF